MHRRTVLSELQRPRHRETTSRSFSFGKTPRPITSEVIADFAEPARDPSPTAADVRLAKRSRTTAFSTELTAAKTATVPIVVASKPTPNSAKQVKPATAKPASVAAPAPVPKKKGKARLHASSSTASSSKSNPKSTLAETPRPPILKRDAKKPMPMPMPKSKSQSKQKTRKRSKALDDEEEEEVMVVDSRKEGEEESGNDAEYVPEAKGKASALKGSGKRKGRKIPVLDEPDVVIEDATLSRTADLIVEALSDLAESTKAAYPNEEDMLDAFVDRFRRSIEASLFKAHERLVLEQTAQRVRKQLITARGELLALERRRGELQQRLKELQAFDKQRVEKDAKKAQVDEFLGKWQSFVTGLRQQAASDPDVSSGHEVALASNLEGIIHEIQAVVDAGRHTLPRLVHDLENLVSK
ncbi:putative mitochondrial protein [Andalucia godoyi]|uniref:Putative mitochondrial protein n=1 Tax=Andalucia godoyi TaxID=505711 RepID=A0A8K0AHQ9_ANDGO|nr:putative mitochondrial protein [Andalucia godoyi]|eukprot:ANDGO_02292.mRNA.1 putative mitochondrial protein